MPFNMPNFVPAIPEMFMLSMICIILLCDVFVQQERRVITYFLTQFTLVVTALISVSMFHMPTTITFSGLFILDPVATLLKILIYFAGFFVFWYSRDYLSVRSISLGENYILGLLSILGMMVLVSSHNFLTLFLGVELSALPVYAMVALWRDSFDGSEASMKYFVIGALASAMLLYGLSMLYGVSGSLDMSVVANTLANTDVSSNIIFVFGLVFVLVGVAFKFGAAPFHMWVPDVYQGAPSPMTLFISSVPKIAAYGMAVRLLINALPGLHIQWQEILILISILSMALGNFAAIVQNNLKRMLAYSSIAHMGYMLLGLLCGTPAGYAAGLFYMLAYAIMAIGGFAFIVLLSKAGFEADHINDLKGLNERNPWLAFMLLLLMFSMAGIPPSVGFFAKLGVLEALIGVNLIWLAALALVFAIIGAYYYIRVVKVMYFEEPDNKIPFTYSKDLAVAMSINGIAVLYFGIFPDTLISICRAAFQ